MSATEENLRYGKQEKKPNLEEAVAKALQLVKGTYGLAVVSIDYSDRITIARNSSPLIIGIGKGENIITSDVSALIGKTKDVIYLNYDELAVVGSNSIKLINLHNRMPRSKHYL